jgi:hypothetical protein
MSNYLALASVTAAFGRIIAEALERVPEPSGIPRVRFGTPQNDPQFIGCTLFVYRISVNAFRRNEDLPVRDEDGLYVERPAVALDAEYILTFFGEETTLEPQRFLGSVVSAVHARPVLSRDEIQRMTEATPYLRGSDLGTSLHRVRLAPTALDHHAMTQVWGTFPQIPYRISVAYTASTITIDADVTPRTIPPVREVTFDPPVGPR